MNAVAGDRLLLDTSMKKLTLQHKWEANTAYNLIVDKDFAEDTLGAISSQGRTPPQVPHQKRK